MRIPKASSAQAITVPLELRVLVTGDGAIALGGHTEAVHDSLRSVLTSIRDSVGSVLAIHRDEAGVIPECRLSLLAFGSDATGSIGPGIAEACGYDLSVIAQSPVAAVANEVRVVTFGYDAAKTDASHLGRAVKLRDTAALQFSDLVVVVWDGVKTDDFIDGTFRILHGALLARKCVIWISPSASPEVKISSLEGLARVDVLNFPEEPDRDSLVALFVAYEEHHDPNLETIIDLQTSSAALDQIQKLFDRRTYVRRPGLIDRYARKLILTKRDRSKYNPRYSWPVLPDTAWGAVPEFDDPFEKADVAANLAAGKYRSRTWLLYLLGALAVILGSIGNALIDRSRTQFFFHLGEVAAVAGVLLVFVTGRGLHQQWTDLRSFAEHLRYQRFVYPLAGTIAPLHQPLWLMDSDGALQINHSTAWLLHRLNVAAGLPALGRPVLDIAAALQEDELKDELISVVKSQLTYHKAKMKSEGRLHRHLEVVSFSLFFLTVAAVIIRLINPHHFVIPSAVLGVLVVSLPALASALFAIGAQLELSRIAKQSEEQAESLDQHLRAIAQIQQSANRDPWLTAIEVRRLLIQSADLMVSEFAAWRALVRSHQLSL